MNMNSFAILNHRMWEFIWDMHWKYGMLFRWSCYWHDAAIDMKLLLTWSCSWHEVAVDAELFSWTCCHEPMIKENFMRISSLFIFIWSCWQLRTEVTPKTSSISYRWQNTYTIDPTTNCVCHDLKRPKTT